MSTDHAGAPMETRRNLLERGHAIGSYERNASDAEMGPHVGRDFGLASPETVLSEAVCPRATVDDLARGCVHASEESGALISTTSQRIRCAWNSRRNAILNILKTCVSRG